MVNFLKLWRWPNLAIIAFTILALKHFVFENYIVVKRLLFFQSQFTYGQTFLLIVSVCLVAIGGYLINDINDLPSDRINKKGKVLIDEIMPLKVAHFLYGAFTVAGIGLGYFLAYQCGLKQLAFFHLLSAALLWLYASYFKSSILIGNVLISLLSALVPLCYFAFETITYSNEFGNVIAASYNQLLSFGPVEPLYGFALFLAGFGFLFTLLRELIKDIQDVEGDQYLGGQTLAQYLGTTYANHVAKGLVVVNLIALLFVNYAILSTEPFDGVIFQIYFYALLIAPNLFLLKELFKPEPNYGNLSLMVKIIMLFGLLSTYLYSFLL